MIAEFGECAGFWLGGRKGGVISLFHSAISGGDGVVQDVTEQEGCWINTKLCLWLPSHVKLPSSRFDM